MSAWGSKGVWGAGGGSSSSQRSRLPKGEEVCNICMDEEKLVEIKFQPCGHAISCLDCFNTQRQGVVLRVRVLQIESCCNRSPGGSQRGIVIERAPPPTFSLPQADAGVKCAICRAFVDGVTDLHG